MEDYSLTRRLAAEMIGSGLLLAAITGTSMLGARAVGEALALNLFASSLAIGCLLTVLIMVFAPISGAHLNPAVTFAVWLGRSISAKPALLYVLAQILGAVSGIALAQLTFPILPAASSAIIRGGAHLWLSEGVATFGLVLTVLATAQHGHSRLAAAVGLYIAAAYWFTAFVNPAVALAFFLFDAPSLRNLLHALVVVSTQVAGGTLAVVFWIWLTRAKVSAM